MVSLNDKGYSTPSSDVSPNTYKIGTTYEFGNTDHGFPINDLLTTKPNSIGMGSQFLTTYDAASPIVYFRSFYGGTYRNWAQLYPVVVSGLIFDRGSQPSNTTTPNSYPNNQTIYDFGTLGNGFPINGFLVTERQLGNGFIRQTLTSYDTATNMYLRVGYGYTWQAWKQINLS